MSTDIHDPSDKTYVVFGAPGSATSFIAKALNDAGVNMHIPKDHKRKFYEDTKMVNSSVRILNRAGGDWTEPPTDEQIDAIDISDEIKRNISKRKSRFWGFKDPRLSLTARKFLPHLEDDVYLICCFRRPSKTLESWRRSGKTTKPNEKWLLDRLNRSIIRTIKEFCEL